MPTHPPPHSRRLARSSISSAVAAVPTAAPSQAEREWSAPARRGAAQLAEAFRAERAARALAEDGANHTFAGQGGIKGGVLGACPAPRTLWVSRGSARPGLGSGWDAGWSASGLLLPTSREQEGSVVWLTGIHSYIVSSRASSPLLVPVWAGAPAAAVGAPPPLPSRGGKRTKPG